MLANSEIINKAIEIKFFLSEIEDRTHCDVKLLSKK